MPTLAALDHAVLAIQRVIAIGCSLFIVLGIGAIAALRYAFKADLYGLPEFISIAAFWLYFMGASYATRRGSHITAEVFSIYCRNRVVRDLVAILSGVITTGLAILYSIWGWDFVYWGLTNGGRSSVWGIPLVVGHAAVFVGFVLMSVYFLLDLWARLRQFASGGSADAA